MLERLFYRKPDGVERLQQSVEVSFERVKQDTSSMFQWIAQLWQHAAQQERRFAELRSSISALPSTEQVTSRVLDVVERRFDFTGMRDRVRQCERVAIETSRAAHDVEDLRSDVQELSKQVSELQTAQRDRPHIDVESLREELQSGTAALSGKVDALRELQLPVLDRLRMMAAEVAQLKRQPVRSVRDTPARVERVVVEKPLRSRLQEHVLKNVVRNSKEFIRHAILQLILKHERISGLQLRDVIVDEQRLTSKSSFYRILEDVEKEQDVTVVVDGKEKVFLVQASAKKRSET
mgnify:CR=1 FL=1